MQKNILLIFIFSAYSAMMQAQEIKIIDLADNVYKVSESLEAKQPVLVRILNRCPGNKYELTLTRLVQEIPPFDAIDQAKLVLSNANSSCDELKALITKIYTTGNEREIPGLRNALETLIKKVGTSCAVYEDAKHLQNRLDTTIRLLPFSKGETLHVIIKRTKPSEEKWEAVYSTGSRGVWKTTYGYAFIPNWFSREKRYFLDSANIITREHDLKKMDYAPGIFFTWFPSRYANSNFSPGVSGGLGINFSIEPVIFLGGSLTYNYNLSINFGLVGYRQNFLKGRYKEGDVINEENFDEETGLHQKLFRANPFISLSLRFGENPFKPTID